jgi:hypothetical protein
MEGESDREQNDGDEESDWETGRKRETGMRERHG